MNWYRITVHTVTEAVEAISYCMEEELGAKGVEISDPKDILLQKKSPLDWDYVDEELLKELDREEVLVRVYFSEAQLSSPDQLESLLMQIREKVRRIGQFLPVGSGRIDTSLMAEEDWANNWKKYYKPFHIGRVFIVPSWMEAEPAGEDLLIRRLAAGPTKQRACVFKCWKRHCQEARRFSILAAAVGFLELQRQSWELVKYTVRIWIQMR